MPQFEAVGFQYYLTNGSVPPQYQRVTIIQGKINPESITISYEYKIGEKTTRQNFELKGGEYKKCLEMIQNTKLTKNGSMIKGADSISVTLSGKNDEDKMGDPSNLGEWTKFLTEIEQKVKSKRDH